MALRALAAALALCICVSGMVLGGAAPAANAAVDRIGGADRYETSAMISRADPSGADVVFLASGTVFSDALAAAPVAASEGGRLLLSQSGSIPDSVVAEIERLRPREIVIVGGPATLSESVRAQASRLAPLVTRIGGANRTDVSFALLERQRETGTAPERLWVVSGNVFADALSAASVAARYGDGMVLTTGINGTFAEQLQAAMPGISDLTIAGGPASVGPDVAALLERMGPAVERIGGADRYAVSVHINQRFTADAADRRMLLASGEVFTDGLAGAVLAGALDAPMYLTPQRCSPTNAVAGEVRRLSIRTTTVLGGQATVSAAAAELINCATLRGHAGLLLDRLNDERASAGLPPLASDPCLTEMAREWAGEMGAGRMAGWAHNPDLNAEARACGMRGWSENVGRTVSRWPDSERMTSIWMHSSSHRANILRSDMEYLGVGIAKSTSGSWYYVLDFGSR